MFSKNPDNEMMAGYKYGKEHETPLPGLELMKRSYAWVKGYSRAQAERVAAQQKGCQHKMLAQEEISGAVMCLKCGAAWKSPKDFEAEVAPKPEIKPETSLGDSVPSWDEADQLRLRGLGIKL